MLGIISEKLDKEICLISLTVISLIIMIIYSPSVSQIFNISGAFKQ